MFNFKVFIHHSLSNQYGKQLTPILEGEWDGEKMCLPEKSYNMDSSTLNTSELLCKNNQLQLTVQRCY